MYAFAKPADFEFPRGKVLRLEEQQMAWHHPKDNSRAPELVIITPLEGQLSGAWTDDLFTHVFMHILSSQQRKKLARVFRTGPPWTNQHSCNQTHLDSSGYQ